MSFIVIEHGSTIVVNVGIVGFGFMGKTHFGAYQADPRAIVTGLMSINRESFSDDSAGNITGQGQLGDYSSAQIYDTLEDLLANNDIDAVSICTPTHLHAKLALQALSQGKHVLLEKPLCRSWQEAQVFLQELQAFPDLVCMPAMCMRFWPGWTWLKEQVDQETYGRVLSATFTRLGSAPLWGDGFYQDANRCGGAILDLHVHDVDFIRYCFGEPQSVHAYGRVGKSSGVDHVVARFGYEHDALITAEGGWLPSSKFPFQMGYRVAFESGIAEYQLGREQPLIFIKSDGDQQIIELSDQTGYEAEVAHFLDCVESRKNSSVVTAEDGAESLRLIDAELSSIETGRSTVFANVNK
ncbi:MAG: Gfo/Idh/MocA family oxidoreductase [Phycisphaerales bacterium]|nr:Gfo/Idh/MocA family oxidoreductase [Phycisphaerales bacterium]